MQYGAVCIIDQALAQNSSAHACGHAKHLLSYVVGFFVQPQHLLLQILFRNHRLTILQLILQLKQTLNIRSQINKKSPKQIK
jgi:hypothetical protein